MGYTYKFLVYNGKSGDRDRHANGLRHEVVTSLSKQLLNQGYKLFTDNFYISVKLFEDLLQYKLVLVAPYFSSKEVFQPV